MSIFRQAIPLTLASLFMLNFYACGEINDTPITVSGQNKYFKLVLSVRDDVVGQDGVLDFSATVERLTHKDSTSGVLIVYNMKLDGSNGDVDLHTITNSTLTTSASKIVFTTDIGKEKGSTFQALASYAPKATWQSSLKKYLYKEYGNVTASFNGINLVVPIQILCCAEAN